MYHPYGVQFLILILFLTLITRPDCSGSSLNLGPIFLQVLKWRPVAETFYMFIFSCHATG